MTSRVADELKRIGFLFATKSGLSIGQDDMVIPNEKDKIIDDASEAIKKIQDFFNKGLITDDERYTQTINV